ncbi:MAG: hypothetical protein HY318_17920, partial [Armatimonadetes bacterium]|nr:hypothetical protein [Armatimonadota bacterium]
MSRASIVCCFVIVGHLAIHSPGWADGAVAGADFEKGLDGCSTWWGSPVNLTNELAHSGKQCLRIPGNTFSGTDYLPIKGRRLGFRLWLRGVEVQRGENDWNNLTVQAQFFDADKKPVGHNDYFHQEGTFDWREVSGAITAMKGAAFVRIGVGLWGCPGTAYLDDLTVSIQAIELEAEEMSLVGAQPRNVEGASGDRAVDLTDRGQSLSTTVELPAGEYSLLVRARGLQPDTFCEVSLLQNGEEIATLTPTCPIFTRQRRHFTVSATGKVELAFQPKEGAGVTLDQVTLSPLTTGLPITSLKGLWFDTNLGGNGKANCVIVLPGRGEYERIGKDLAASLRPLLGQRPVVVAADKLERSLRGQTHFICLGDYLNNHEILAVSPNPFFLIPKPPSGTPSVITYSDPWGTGANTIILGGADAAALSAAAKRMLSLLRKTEGGTVLPWTWEPSPPVGVSREEYKRLVIESGKWMRQGGIRSLQTEWKQHGVEMFRVLGYRYLEYRDSSDTIPPLT